MQIGKLRHVLADVRTQLAQARSKLKDARSARYYIDVALNRIRELPPEPDREAIDRLHEDATE